MECLSQSEVLAVIFNNLTTKVSTLGPYKGTKKCTSLISFIKFWPSILDKEIQIFTLCLPYWKANCYQSNNVWSWPQHEHFTKLLSKLWPVILDMRKKYLSQSDFLAAIITVVKELRSKMFSQHPGYIKAVFLKKTRIII